MSVPKKHHYIPQFLLKRFQNENKKIYLGYKEYGKGSYKSPSQVCYQEDLYTLIHGSKKYTFLEEGFAKLEKEFASAIEFFSDEKNSLVLKKYEEIPEVIQVLSVFLNISFWRLPFQLDEAIEQQSKLLKVFDLNQSNLINSLKIERKIIRNLAKNKSKNAIHMSRFFFFPVLINNEGAIRECEIVHTDFDLIISDRPIICSINADTLQMEGDIYMPLGNRMCITNKRDKINEFQAQIFQNASKYVVAKSEGVIKQLLE